MRKLSLALSAAIGSILAASSAMAIDVSGYPTQLTMSGSSAQQATAKDQLASLCVGNAVTEWNVTGLATNPNIRAYTCTLDGTNPDLVAAGIPGGNAVVWYRAEGGSVYGVAPIENSQQIYRIKLDSNCDDVAHTCPINSFDLGTETGSGNLEFATTELGISDVEPAQFKNENWPAGVFGPAPLSTVNGVGLNGVVFGVAVSNNGATANITNLSKASLTAIFSGQYTNWNQVEKADGTGKYPAAPIFVCRRDIGSGTQASASIFFNHQGCSASAYSFVKYSDANPTGGRVRRNNTSGEMKNCIAGLAGAIGFYNGDPNNAAAGTHWVTINGTANTEANAANGVYDYWYEGTANVNPSLDNTHNGLKLANLLITRLQNYNNIPASTSTIALPTAGNPPGGTGAHGIPVGYYWHSGDSCKYIK